MEWWDWCPAHYSITPKLHHPVPAYLTSSNANPFKYSVSGIEGRIG
jgi:hypothetical protein